MVVVRDYEGRSGMERDGDGDGDVVVVLGANLVNLAYSALWFIT